MPKRRYLGLGLGIGLYASLAAAAAPVVIQPLRFGATRGELPNAIPTQATTAAACRRIARMRAYVASVDQTELRIGHTGFYCFSNSGEASLGNDVAIEGYLEIPTAPIKSVQITWGGSPSGLIPNGSNEYISDAILPSSFGLTVFTANTEIWWRTARTVTLNQFHMTNKAAQNPLPTGEVCIQGDPATFSTAQLSGTGALSSTGGTVIAFEMPPMFTIGRGVSPTPAWIICGDSLPTFLNDRTGDGTNDNGGFVARGLSNIDGAGTKVAWARVSNPSERCSTFITTTKRLVLAKYADRAYVNYITNDIANGQSAATIKTNLRTMWGLLKTNLGGIKYVTQCLCQVRTTGAWTLVDLSDQTVAAAFASVPVVGAVRGPANTQIILDVVAANQNVDNYFDPNPTIADTIQTDKWQANGTVAFATSDGTHESRTYHALVAVPFAAYANSLPAAT